MFQVWNFGGKNLFTVSVSPFQYDFGYLYLCRVLFPQKYNESSTSLFHQEL